MPPLSLASFEPRSGVASGWRSKASAGVIRTCRRLFAQSAGSGANPAHAPAGRVPGFQKNS